MYKTNQHGKFQLTLLFLAEWKKAMSTPEYRNWFSNEENQKSDEKKRVKESEMNEFSGMQGTFRTLCID